ncbi:MAG: hypothetical protein QM775_33690 [Pirellulales bacterium]
MPYRLCKQCCREFSRDPADPIKWAEEINVESGEVKEGKCDVCSDCWHRGWFTDPWPLGSGDPDWSPRPQ